MAVLGVFVFGIGFYFFHKAVEDDRASEFELFLNAVLGVCSILGGTLLVLDASVK